MPTFHNDITIEEQVLYSFSPQGVATMTLRTYNMPCSEPTIICVKSLMNQFSHEGRNLMNNTHMLYEITQKFHFGVVSKIVPR